MTDNGTTWTWIVGVLEGLGDFAAQVPDGVLAGSKLPDEFEARRISHLAPQPIPGKNQSSLRVVPWLGHAFRIVSDNGVVRLRGASVLIHARASRELAEEAEKIWNPPTIVAAPPDAIPRMTDHLRKLRGD